MFKQPDYTAIDQLSQLMRDWVKHNPAEVLQDPASEAAGITFNVGPGQSSEMLRIAEDGFYVRGVRVPADDLEAGRVYRSFKSWLAWAQMNRP